ncbi:MAG: type II secretion system secretin GspD [Gallionella sp.]
MIKDKSNMDRMPELVHTMKAWRCRSVILAMLCAMTAVHPAHAQDSGRDEPGQTNAGSGPGNSPPPPVTPVKKETATAAANKDGGSNTGTLNFVDADIESVIAAVGDYTNTTFIIDPRVKGTLTLVSEKPLTKSQAFQLLTSVLRLRGYTVVTGNGYTKVVPEAEAKLQASPMQGGGVRGDQIATQVFHLNFENAANLVAVLRPLISPNNTINADPGNNTLVITDYADNLLRLGKIISTLDEPAGNDLDVVPIRYAISTDIATIVNRLLEQGAAGAGAGDAGRVTVLAYPRTNSVLIRASSEARVSLAKTLIEKLDQPTAEPGNVHVVYLKNAEATKLAQTLRAVVTSDTSASTSGSPQSTRSVSQTTTSLSTPSSSLSSPSSTSSSSSQTTLSTGGPAGFIQADATTNTLIITASESVYRDLRAVIDKLDARRAQVYIESLIVEVDANNSAELGAQFAGLSGDSNSNARLGAITGFTTATSGNNLISQLAGKAAGTVLTPPGNGLTVGILNSAGLGAVIHALETNTSANILSMPNLITLDNEEAKIIVGSNVPFITGQYTTPASGGTAGVNPFQTVERQDIGLTLRVRPQISQGGTVKMAIYQENSAVTDSTNPAGLITSKRSLDTNVVVDDGQIIVLGGLIDDNLQDTTEQVPLLGDIPFLGALFRYKTRSHVKTNLMVFLRPTIIRNNEQSVDLTADRYDYIRNEEVTGQPEKTAVLPNMEPPQLPPLKDGRMVGGRLEQVPSANQKAAPVQEAPVPQQPAAPQ